MVINRCSHLNIDCLNLTDFIVKGLEYFLFNDFCVLVAQSCLTLCSSMDFSLPGSSVHGILQTRVLEWVAMPSSRGSFHSGIEPATLMSSALAPEPQYEINTHILLKRILKIIMTCLRSPKQISCKA